MNRSLEGKEWLVGDKMTFAYVVFVPYNSLLYLVSGCHPDDALKGSPNVDVWHKRISPRDSWKKVQELRAFSRWSTC